MENHKISWRNAGEISPAFLQKILQLIMEKNEKWQFLFTSTVVVDICLTSLIEGSG